MRQYQVTLNPDGTVESSVQLPDEPEKKRVIFIRETTEARARKRAEQLFSLAK